VSECFLQLPGTGRIQFTGDQGVEFLAGFAAHSAALAGAVGLLLRREGLYSSHLATWKRQRKQGGINALTPKKRGPKVVVSPLLKQNREQQAVIARLTKKLKNAELIIEVQKKVAALLGNPIPNIRIDEENS